MRDGEGDVKSIQAVLGITHSGVSQHLMTFRAHRLVSECRQVFYRLRQPELATWLTKATHFLEDSEGSAFATEDGTH